MTVGSQLKKTQGIKKRGEKERREEGPALFKNLRAKKGGEVTPIIK